MCTEAYVISSSGRNRTCGNAPCVGPEASFGCKRIRLFARLGQFSVTGGVENYNDGEERPAGPLLWGCALQSRLPRRPPGSFVGARGAFLLYTGGETEPRGPGSLAEIALSLPPALSLRI